MIKENKWVLIGSCLVLLALVVGYFLLTAERNRQLAINEDPEEPPALEASVIEDQSLGELEVTLYVHRLGESPNSRLRTGSPLLRSNNGTAAGTPNLAINASKEE